MAKIFICGDIMNTISNGDFVGDSLVAEINKADYAICNLEGPEVEDGQMANCPHQEPGTIAYLKRIGFDLMLLANNHIAELGARGIRQTINAIGAAGADYIGAGLSWKDAYSPIIRNIGGMSFGFINVCEAQPRYYYSPNQLFGYAWMGYNDLFDDIKKLKKKTDHVVVFVHAGLEHYSLPLPEFRSFYKKICDAGASCVIGSHPHCAQGYEYYGDKFIAYSLGNFFFTRSNDNWTEENTSYSLLLDFQKKGGVSITPVHHRLDKGIVDLIIEEAHSIRLTDLCNLLQNNYEYQVNEMCEKAYTRLITYLIAYATCGEYEGMTLWAKIKNSISQILFRKKFVKYTRRKRQRQLLHLFENESYRYTIIRALNNKIL